MRFLRKMESTGLRRVTGGAAAALLVTALVSPAKADLTVGVGQSTEPWLGFMNVFELPINGGGFVFGSPWGVSDLVATFDDPANTLTLSPNTIADPDPFWYIGGGGPGAPGNKIMEANLYQEFPAGALAGETLTFEGTVLSNTFTPAHNTVIFIKDFAPDFSSFNITTVPAVPGPFSVSMALDPGPGRHVQYGFQTVGVNVWPTDVAPFGNVVIGTIPEPASLSLLALGGLLAVRRRRA
ncbi:MAG: PEP-CTERM sorting domain-containing protein [Planctomycetota bacterium]|nr:MAG: PEP-CTERM sorting domain-containing protein [Planctomycetota bacterium]